MTGLSALTALVTHCEESAGRDIIIRREHPGSSVLITPFVKHRFGKTDHVDYLGWVDIGI